MAVTHATTLSSFSHFMISLPAASLQPRYSSKKRICVDAECSGFNYSSWNIKGLSRRLLFFTGFVPILSNVNLASGAPIPQMEEPEIIRTRKLPGGTRVQDVVDGEGQAANEGDVVVFNYVCRRANGYFVYSTVDQFTGEAKPVTLPLDENQVNNRCIWRSTEKEYGFAEIIKGLKDVLVGMKVGGKRRALIPPSIGYVNEHLKPIPEEFGPRRSLLSHANEPLVFEVQLLKIL